MVALAAPTPQDVTKTANIQKTSEYHVTADNHPLPGALSRPAPINPEVKSDPKPSDSGKITLLDSAKPKKRETTSVKKADEPTSHGATSFHAHEIQVEDLSQSSTPSKTPVLLGPVTVAPISSVDAHKITHRSNDEVPSTYGAIPEVPARRTPQVVGVQLKSTAAAASTVAPTTTNVAHEQHKRETDSSEEKDDSKESKESSVAIKPTITNSRRTDDLVYDNKPPTYVHPVPVTQILGESPVDQTHQQSSRSTNNDDTPAVHTNHAADNGFDAKNSPSDSLNPSTIKPTLKHHHPAKLHSSTTLATTLTPTLSTASPPLD